MRFPLCVCLVDFQYNAIIISARFLFSVCLQSRWPNILHAHDNIIIRVRSRRPTINRMWTQKWGSRACHGPLLLGIFCVLFVCIFSHFAVLWQSSPAHIPRALLAALQLVSCDCALKLRVNSRKFQYKFIMHSHARIVVGGRRRRCSDGDGIYSVKAWINFRPLCGAAAFSGVRTHWTKHVRTTVLYMAHLCVPKVPNQLRTRVGSARLWIY